MPPVLINDIKEIMGLCLTDSDVKAKLRRGSMAGLAIAIPITQVVDIMLCVHALQAPTWRHLMNSFQLSHMMYTIRQCLFDADWHTQAGLCRQS